MKMIDAFGDLKVDGHRSRARLIQVTPITYAAFESDNPDTPMLLTATGPATIKGRNVTLELIGGGIAEFRRAGCGCQTPSNLRGPQGRFLSRIPAPVS